MILANLGAHNIKEFKMNLRSLLFTLIASTIMNLPSLVFASSCTGQSIDCFDQETQNWKSFPQADTCEDYHNGKRWLTRAYCSKEGSSPSLCSGKSIDCFDQETQNWKSFPDANACEDYHNGTRWITRAYCK
jgi:hypothetical protein